MTLTFDLESKIDGKAVLCAPEIQFIIYAFVFLVKL